MNVDQLHRLVTALKGLQMDLRLVSEVGDVGREHVPRDETGFPLLISPMELQDRLAWLLDHWEEKEGLVFMNNLNELNLAARDLMESDVDLVRRR